MASYNFSTAIFSALLVSTSMVSSCNNSSNEPTDRIDSLKIQKDKNAASKLELVFSDNTYQLTGVAKEPGGRLLVNYPFWSDVYRYAVVQATGDTTVQPFPDETWNQWKPGQSGQNKWVCVQSVYYDDSTNLYILDPAAPKLKTIQANGAKLVRMKKDGSGVERVYSFTGMIPDTAYMNDVRVDVPRQYAYLTESKGGGIVVVNLETGKMRRVLSKHPSVKSDPNFKFVIDGKELMKDGKPAKFNSDGIALTPDGNWLYYKPLTDDKLYRIRTEFLRDWNIGETELHSKVEDLGHFTTTDGMIFDQAGYLYLGDLINYRIIRISPDHKMTTLVEDKRLIWPDSYSIADGYLYISCSQIQKQPEYNEGKNLRNSPYTVYRVKL